MAPRRVGVVGYGKLGQFLVEKIQSDPNMTLAFVWNRTRDAIGSEVDSALVCSDLTKVAEFSPDIIIEVAHPCISKEYGVTFLQVCNLIFF